MEIKFISECKIENIPNSTMDEMDDYLNDLYLISVDTEDTGLDPFYHKVLLIILGNNKRAYVIDCRTINHNRIRESFKKIENKIKILHNAKYDYKMLKQNLQISLTNMYCTMVSCYVLYNGIEKEHNLANVVYRFFGKILSKSTRNSFINKPDSESFTYNEVMYAGKDIEYLENIYYKLKLLEDKLKVENTINIEMNVISVLGDIELAGLEINENKWREQINIKSNDLNVLYNEMKKEILELNLKYDILSKPFKKDAKNHKLATYDMFDENFNISYENNILNALNMGSPSQLSTLFKRLRLEIEGTSAENIEYYLRTNLSSDKRKFLKLLLKYRELEKFLSTYGEAFLNARNKITNRIHTELLQVFTDTGRLSSRGYKIEGDEDDDNNSRKEGANLQNIPHDKNIRSCFIARSGYKIITIDYSGQEIAIAATQSKDAILISSCNSGLDIHSFLATNSFAIIMKDPNIVINKKENSHLRDIHKRVLFGYFYGAGVNRLADVLDISKDIAKKVYKKLQSVLWELTSYQNKIRESVKKTHMIRDHSYTNRFKYFKAYELGDMQEYKMEKEAINFPIQSTGASMIKEALIECDRLIKDNDLNARILLTVHDEIVFEVEESIADDLAIIFAEKMEEVAHKYIDVQIKAEYKVSNNWEK